VRKKILDIKLGGLMKKPQRNYASDFSQSLFIPLTMSLLTVEKIVCKSFQITLLDILMLHSLFPTMDCRRGHQGEILSSHSNQSHEQGKFIYLIYGRTQRNLVVTTFTWH